MILPAVGGSDHSRGVTEKNMTAAKNQLTLDFHPLTLDRWADFETLFGERGACGGCWCMLWRLQRSVFDSQKGAGNREAMRSLVAAGEVPGILAYAGGEPVGWCAVAPRERYPALDRSRVLRRIDETPVWSVSCLFVARGYRKQGVSVQLLKAAVAWVGEQGGRVVEGYPVEPKKDEVPAVFAWTGLASAFRRAGFVECARGSETRPIMRRTVKPKRR
jgi:GNAT superfamily N-acetyltransferase